MVDGVILLVVDNKGNRQLLRDMLKRHHTVKVLEADDDLKESFDLGIFDGVSLSRLRKQIVARQDSEPGLFLPILLVASRQDISLMTRQLWKLIDEMIFAPIEKIELLARVQVLLRTRNSSVELSRLYKNASEQATFAERQRLARELHDTVSQMIFSASALAQTLPQIQAKDPVRAKDQLEEVVQLNRSALAQMRALLFDLRPGNLNRMPLAELLDQLAIAARGRRPISIITSVDVNVPLPESVHLGLYRIVQETLNNIVKHSEATEASINLSIRDGQLVLRIKDNGIGFDTGKQAKGFGLDGMHERAELMNATLSVSSSKGEGTEIVVTQPIPEAVHSVQKP
jgi:signal transduction histidine kinase